MHVYADDTILIEEASINGVSWPPPENSRSRTPTPPPELPKAAPPPKEFIIETDSFYTAELSTASLPPNTFDDSNFEVPPAIPKSRPPSIELIETDGLHQALKALVTPVEEEMHLASFESSSTNRVQTSAHEVTSDSDMSFTNFYDVEHSQVIRKSGNEDVHIPIGAKPLGVSYKSFSETEMNNNDQLKQDAKPRVYIKAVSSTSLIEDSFDAPPKILHQKKDNTLISKIYQDPKVRLYALNSREDLLAPDDRPLYYTQRSFDSRESSSVTLSKSKLYNSSDDITSEYESGKTGKMSFFSSEEDLLSLNSESSSRRNEVVATKNEEVKISSSSPSTRKFIYGSQDDLLSIEESGHLAQRKDNTIVSKIYTDPKVRDFALKSHRKVVPDFKASARRSRRISSSDEERYHSDGNVTTRRPTYHNMFSSFSDLSSADISIEINSDASVSLVKTLSKSGEQSHVEDGYKSEDLEVEELSKRHVVSHALDKLLKLEAQFEPGSNRRLSLEDKNGARLSVRDLKKRFEKSEASKKPVVSSLTARSLSKQVKESLKQ